MGACVTEAFRAAIWVASAPATNMVSPMLNYGLGAISPAHGWKNMYYFAGALTMSWSLVVWWKLPDDM
jgi:sugar phosphate permease